MCERQRGGVGVASGRDQLQALGPLDSHLGIVVGEAALELCGVVGRGLIDDVRPLAQHAEAVREPVGAVELVVVRVAELKSLPLPERRRAAPDVDEHVEDRAVCAAHELRHPRLDVHPADDPTPGARVVILDEVIGDTEIGEGAAAVGLLEEATVVAMDDRFDQDRTGQCDGKGAHQRPGLGSRWRRSASTSPMRTTLRERSSR